MKARLTGHFARMFTLPGLRRSSTVSRSSPEQGPVGGILDNALAKGMPHWRHVNRSRRHPSDRSCIHMTKGTEIRYHVRGGTPLNGTVFIQGAKNAALKMIAASLLAAKGRTVLRNVPPIEDVRRAAELAQAIGAVVEFHESERTLVVDASRRCCTASVRRSSRASADATSATGTLISTTGASPGSARSWTRASRSSGS